MSTSTELALAPLIAALLAAAESDAHAAGEAAAHTTTRLSEQAKVQADAVLAEARSQGRADAVAVRAAAQAGVRRQARSALLRARSEVYEQLRMRARQAVVDLRDQPDYARLRNHLAQAVWHTLGGDAVVRDADAGGVVGEVAGRRMDCSLTGFADRAVEELAWELFDGEPAAAPEASPVMVGDVP